MAKKSASKKKLKSKNKKPEILFIDNLFISLFTSFVLQVMAFVFIWFPVVIFLRAVYGPVASSFFSIVFLIFLLGIMIFSIIRLFNQNKKKSAIGLIIALILFLIFASWFLI